MMAGEDILAAALEAARRKGIPTIVVASTTGKTASALSKLAKTENLRMIVVTHDEGKPAEARRFDEGVRLRLLADRITVYTHDPRYILARKIAARLFGRFGFPRWYKHLDKVKMKYGTGIKVCHIITQMLIEGGILREGRVVAIAGTKSGADSAATFSVKPDNKWPVLDEIIVGRG